MDWKDNSVSYSVTLAIIASVVLLLFSFLFNYSISTPQFLTILIIIVLGALITEYMFGRGKKTNTKKEDNAKGK